MRLVTFQDRFILEKINWEEKKGKIPLFLCNKVNFLDREVPMVIKFIDKMKEALKINKERDMIPIWCWVVPKNQELTDEYLLELYSRYIPNCKNIYMYELEVPNEHVFITNFEVWEDILFKLKFRMEVSDELFNRLFQKQKGAIIQASIPFIHKDYIKNMQEINRIENNYEKTEREVSELISQGSIKLDEDGYIESITGDMDDDEEI